MASSSASAKVRHRNPGVKEDFGGELGLGVAANQPQSLPQPQKWRTIVDNTLWLAAALFILYYGDSRTDFFALVFYDPRIRRVPFNLALACLVINSGIFFYLAFWLRHLLKNSDNWDVIAPAAIPAATIIGLLATVLFGVALWPVWGLLTLPLLFTLFMAFIIISPYLPPYVKPDAGTLRVD